jgi:isopentenyl-diphosphate Delta-isomerase
MEQISFPFTMVEYFDIFDSNNVPLNEIQERNIVHQKGYWHRTSQVWIMNTKRQILCNLRSKTKDLFPNYWDLSIGGHVEAGDTYEATAIRELKEEIGIDTTLNNLIFLSNERVEGLYQEKNLIDREHARLFLFIADVQIENLKVQKEEIEELRLFSIDYLIESIGNKQNLKVVPIKHFFIKILKQLKNYPLNQL